VSDLLPAIDGLFLGETITPRRWDGRRLINLDASNIALGSLDSARFPSAFLTDGSRKITGDIIQEKVNPQFRQKSTSWYYDVRASDAQWLLMAQTASGEKAIMGWDRSEDKFSFGGAMNVFYGHTYPVSTDYLDIGKYDFTSPDPYTYATKFFRKIYACGEITAQYPTAPFGYTVKDSPPLKLVGIYLAPDESVLELKTAQILHNILTQATSKILFNIGASTVGSLRESGVVEDGFLHAGRHAIGQPDAFTSSHLFDAISRIKIRKNTGASDIGARRRLNFIEGTNVTLTVADDPTNEEIDVTIAAAAGGGAVKYTSLAAPRQSVAKGSTVETLRFKLPTNKVLKIWTAAGESTATGAGVTLTLYNVTGSTAIYGINLVDTGVYDEGVPLSSYGPFGGDIVVSVRLINTLSAAYTAGGFFVITIE